MVVTIFCIKVAAGLGVAPVQVLGAPANVNTAIVLATPVLTETSKLQVVPSNFTLKVNIPSAKGLPCAFKRSVFIPNTAVPVSLKEKPFIVSVLIV